MAEDRRLGRPYQVGNGNQVSKNSVPVDHALGGAKRPGKSSVKIAKKTRSHYAWVQRLTYIGPRANNHTQIKGRFGKTASQVVI